MLRYFFIANRGVILTKTTKVKEIDEDENIAASVAVTRVFNSHLDWRRHVHSHRVRLRFEVSLSYAFVETTTNNTTAMIF